MDSPPPDLLDDIAMLRAELALARARMADDAATIARQNLEIAKLQRRIYGARSERTARLIDQMELEFEDIEAAATEDEIAAEQAAAKTTKVVAVTRKRPSRQPFPAHLPRERVLVPGPTACECCGGGRLRKLGETITGTLEVIPRQWKVIRHVREKMTCRDCERIYVRDDRPFKGGASPAAMFYYSRDRGGAHVEAHLARWSGLLQADAYSGCNRLYDAGRKPAPILEAGCWSHARRPFFVLADIESSARRKAEGKVPVPISPLALETVRRIDRLFEIERGINGKSAEERRAVRQELSRPLVADLEAWMRQQRPKCAFRRQRRGESPGWSPMDYMLKRWPAFTRVLDGGRVCMSNNAAERAPRGIALGRKSWHFSGSDRGGNRAAAMYSLIVTAKMNDIDPQAWLADVLARIAGHPASRLDQLLPWHWNQAAASSDIAA